MTSILDRTGDITVFLTDRLGGMGTKSYCSFNLAKHVGDDTLTVDANRKLLANQINSTFEKLIFMNQIHGTGVEIIESIPKKPLDCDAMITNKHGFVLLVLTADCVPIVITDNKNGAVGVAHAGWRGTIGNIVGKTISKMVLQYKSNIAEIQVYLGPAIGSCCYNIGPEVVEAIISNIPNGHDCLFEYENKWFLNLHKSIEHQLVDVGVRPEQIVFINECVSCNNQKYFSYRADGGVTGRQAMGVLVNDKK